MADRAVWTCSACQRLLEDEYRHCPYDGQQHPEPDRVSDMPSNGLFAGRYEILRMLGEGGTARVFKAVDAFTRKPVATKVIEGVMAKTPPWPERLLREVELLRTIEHPNVVRVLDGGQREDGSPFLVMEYLEGDTLGSVVRGASRLPIEIALRILTEVASGLRAAHALGVIHRDVKPDNIFLVGNPMRPSRAKVFDFGMARLQGGAGLTAKGFILGTPEYMAPEQTVNDPTGQRTDIYALGVVMYRMITGRLPFEGGQLELLAQHLAVAPVPPREWQHHIPHDVEAIVLNALRKLPRNRYPSMQDFLEDLEKVSGLREGNVSAHFVEWEDVYEAKSAFGAAMAEKLRAKASRFVRK